jgi:predicted PurR-regulated permease PerM
MKTVLFWVFCIIAVQWAWSTLSPDSYDFWIMFAVALVINLLFIVITKDKHEPLAPMILLCGAVTIIGAIFLLGVEYLSDLIQGAS